MFGWTCIKVTLVVNSLHVWLHNDLHQSLIFRADVYSNMQKKKFLDQYTHIYLQ